jgi:hypothetical protein
VLGEDLLGNGVGIAEDDDRVADEDDRIGPLLAVPRFLKKRLPVLGSTMGP